MELKPGELVEADLIVGLCDRWYKTPDEILAMDARALYYLDVAAKGKREVS